MKTSRLDPPPVLGSREQDSAPTEVVQDAPFFRWKTDVPMAVAILLLAMWRIGTPSMWRDEAVTAADAQSGWRAILQTSHDIDMVHTPFYLLEWLWTSIFGLSDMALRMPSALAITVSAICLTAIARQYTAELNAVLCTVIFALMPAATRYAQEAREGALLIMLGVISTLLLHIAVRRASAKVWVAYAVILALIPPFNVIAAYILLPHLLFALYWKRVKPWCFAAIPALLTAGAMAVLAAPQRATMLDVYVAPPTLRGFVAYADSLFESRTIAVLFVVTAAIFVVMTYRQKRMKEYAWLLALAILPLPLWMVSHVENVFLFRYGLYPLPFFALIAVLVLRLWYVIAVYAVILAMLSLPLDMHYRAADGHGEDFRSLFADIERGAKPGDAIVTDNWMARAAKDYYLHSALADPLDPHGVTSDAIRSAGGTPCTATELAPYQRVWFVWFVRPSTKVAENPPTKCDPSLALKSVVRRGVLTAELYTRN